MPRLVRLITGLVFCVTVASASTLTYTCDPTVDATVAGTCGYLNTQVAGFYTSSFNNISANIYIEQGTTGLASSESAESFVPYSSYLSALTNTASGDGVDTAALAALNSLDTAVYGSDNVDDNQCACGYSGFRRGRRVDCGWRELRAG